MIIDSAFIPGIGVGSERAVQQTGDSQLVVPAMVMPVVPCMLPSRVQQSSGTQNQSSFFAENQNTATNQAAVGTTICTLGKGMWRIQITLAARFNYLGVSPNIDVELNLLWATVWSIRMAQLYAVIGAQTIVFERTILLDTPAQIVLSQAVTGALEVNEASVGINACRLI